MATVPPGDPRLEPQPPNPTTPPQGVAPIVALPRQGLSWAMIAIFMAVLGVLLFTVLDARRQSLNAPAVKPGALDRTSPGAEAPPLYVPPPPPSAPVEPPVQQVQPAPAPALPPPQPQIIYVPQPAPPQQQAAPQQPPRVAGDPALVIDTTSGEAPAGGPGATGAVPPNAAAGGPDSSTRSPGIAGGRVRVAQFANRSSTVPQGTLIPAVLETGLDSTRPGLARAMVTKDVRGFDGTRILIPRGSRLIGEYQAEASPGQKRALVNWIRLIRPDGATIAIGSPVSDPVGRGGMKAKVDNHFFARFTGAILQSALDIGVNLASRSANSPVIVALPGTVQQTTQPLTQQTQQVTPTLKVSPGTSITVFVARDLDFSGADNKP